MATAAVKPGPILAELVDIEGQIEADKERGGEVRTHARAVNNMANKLEELIPTLEELGASGDITKTVDQLREWADVLSPNATTTWDRESVTAQLTMLDAMATLKMLSDDEAEAVERLKVSLRVTKGGTGERAPRQPQPKIEGRPERVSVTGPDGTVFSTQSGNVANSAPNLKTAAVAFIKKSGIDEVSVEDQKGLLAAAKEVTEDGKASAVYQGITFSVATE